MEGLMEDGTKIRKRGCSPSSSASSVIQNYRFKKAILVKKRGGGGGSSTPVPTWRMVGSRSPSVVLRAAISSPRYPPSLPGRSRSGQGQPPVSARKLAATLWELNEVPSPRVAVATTGKEKRVGRKEKARSSVHSGSLPPHLSDPSHSPVSERMEFSGTSSHRRRESSLSRKIKIDSFDSVSNASLMEIESRSRCQTPSGSTVGARTRLKDVSSALTTSKELLKIINRMWGQEDQPSSSMSLMSALHTELERARMQINQLIQEDRSDHKEINYLLKRFAEEKAAWKNKEQEVVKAAVESIAGELEVERKFRRRLESLNKKLGKELAETKESLLKAVKEFENQKRASEIMEQACNERAKNISQKAGIGSGYRRRDGDLAFCQTEAKGSDRGEVEETSEDGGNSAESDLHSIELNMDKPDQNYKSYASMATRNSKIFGVDEELKGRKSLLSQVARRSTSLLRSISDAVEWGNGSNNEAEKQVPRRSWDELQRYKSTKGLRDHLLTSSRLGLGRELGSPSSQRGPPWPSRDPCDVALQRPMTMESSGSRVRLEEGIVEGHYSRRSRR